MWNNVLDYGADPTGVSDSSGAVASAAAALAGSGVVYFPPGSYRFSSSVSVDVTNRGVALVGSGTLATKISASANGLTLFNVTGSGGNARFEHMSIYGAGFTGVTGIRSTSRGGYSRYDDLVLANLNVGLDSREGNVWTLSRSYFATCQTSVVVASDSAVDAGDSTIESCSFDNISLGAGAFHVRQYSSGGLRIVNNKFLSDGSAYYLDPTCAPTSILIIQGNSMEGGGNHIVIPSSSFVGAYVISGNQFSVWAAGSYGISVGNNTVHVEEGSISGNYFWGLGTGIRFDKAADWMVAGNSFGTTVGVNVDNPANTRIGLTGNHYSFGTTAVQNPNGYDCFDLGLGESAINGRYGYTNVGGSIDRSLDGSSLTLAETSNVLMTLISDLKATGLLR